MNLSSAELNTSLAELDPGLRPEDVVQAHPEFCERDVIIRIADEVNRVAREDLNRAEQFAAIISWLADAIDDNYCRARAARCRANINVLRSKNSEALKEISTALELFRDLGEDLEQAATLSSSLQPLIYQGDYAQAWKNAEEAKEIAVLHKDDLLLARLEINFANILHRQDRFREAVQHYQLALEKLTKLQQPRDSAIALVNLAVCYISLQDFRKAEQAYETARELSVREEMPLIVAQADYNIAYLHYYRGEYKAAMELYQKTRVYSASVNDQYHAALCDLDQAEMYLELHLHEEAMRLAEQASMAFEKLQLSYEAGKALVLLGLGLYQSQRSFEALDVFARAQVRMHTEVNSQWIASLDLYQALIFQQEKRFYEALRHGRRAQELLGTVPTFALAETHLLLANVYLEVEQLEEAESWANTSMDTAHILNSPHHLSRAGLVMGKIAESHDRNAQAYSAYQQALEYQMAIVPRLQAGASKIPYSKNRFELYQSIVDLERKEGSGGSDKIFDIVEKAKAREIAELLCFRTNALPTPSRNKSALVEQVNRLREELNWNYRKISTVPQAGHASLTSPDNLSSVIREQEKSLIKTLGELRFDEQEFHSLISAGTVPTNQIRASLLPDELILQFFIVRGLVIACVVQQSSVEIVELGRLIAIRHRLRQLQSAFSETAIIDAVFQRFTESNLAQSLANLKALHSALIEPLGRRLEGRRLIIVPEGPLHYLPFHALFDGDKFLFERHVLSYASSASTYHLSSIKSAFVPIPNADQSESPFGSNGNISPWEKIADVHSFKDFQEPRQFAHLACTVQLRRDNVSFSSLLMGGSEISFLDTFHLKLPCDVLSLSGSGTGLRANEDGRELLTLARGLQYAGARSVLMPLWNARHEATQIFMKVFYENAALNPDRAAAFQIAMAETRKHYSHPFDWASFMIYGKVREATQSGRES